MNKFYLLLCLLILTISCETDELEPFPENSLPEASVQLVIYEDLPSSITSILDDTSPLKHKSALEVNKFGTVRKDIPAYKNIGKNGSISFTLLLQKKLQNKTPRGVFFDNIVIEELSNGGEKIRIIRYEPEIGWYSNPERSLRNYSGSITIFDIEGNNRGNVLVVDGRPVPKQQVKASDEIECMLVLESILCVGGLYGYPETCTYYYREDCKLVGSGGENQNDGGYNPPSSDPGTWSGGDGNTGGGNTGGEDSDTETTPILPFEPRPTVLKVEKDSSLIKVEKINCTYDRLMSTNAIQDILKDFFKEDALFDLTFTVVEDLVCSGKTTASGCATQNTDWDYTVSIDLDYILNDKTPTIFLAQTMIHESVHANLYAAVVKLNNNQIPSDTSFEALYEEYRQSKGWQHEYMAKFLTGLIQTALKEVHPLLNDSRFLNGYDDNTLWDWAEFYETLSYRGLDLTTEGEEYYEENSSEIHLYTAGAEANSTKIPKCDE